MADILKQHAVCHGWDVLLSVGGKPVTLTFPTQPSESALTEAITRFDERMLAEAEVGGEEITNVLDI